MCDWNVPSRVNCEGYGVSVAVGDGEVDGAGSLEPVRPSRAEQPLSVSAAAAASRPAARRERVRGMWISCGVGGVLGQALKPR